MLNFGVGPVIGSVVGSVLGYEYRRRRELSREKQDEKIAWFDEVLDVIGRGAYNIDRAYFQTDPDYDRILEELDQFSERLYVKAENPPDGVPQSAINTVFSIVEIYAKATIVAEINTEKEGVELLSELFEMAQKEQSEEVDYEAAIQDAVGRSDRLSNIMAVADSQGIDTSEVAETVEGILSEWDSDEFSQFILGASDGNVRIDQTIQQSMDLFFTLSKSMSKTAYDALQTEKDNLK